MIEIAGRLSAAGAIAESGDLVQSLQRTWHGLEPVHRDSEGRFGLNLQAFEIRTILRAAVPEPRPAEQPADSPWEPAPDDATPLTAEEIDAAFRDGHVLGLSWIRQAAALLDAKRVAMMPEEIEQFLATLTVRRSG